jgi:hypothetical protein
MPITYDQLNLYAAMQEAFQSYDSLFRFVNERCKKNLNLKTHPVAGLEANFSALLNWAEKDGWMDQLLDAFSNSNVDLLVSAAALSRLERTQLQPVMAVVATDPFGTLFLSRSACFIGRDDLRATLREMQKPDAAFKVLLVEGEKTCGKTYSYELIRRLKTLPENVVERIDFNNFRRGALGQRYRDIVDQINIQMEIPAASMPPQNESDTRWFEHVIRKFDYVAGHNNRQLWLVFDNIPSWEERGEQLADALTKIVEYACLETDHLRVVIIGMRPNELLVEKSIQPRISTNVAMLPSKADIVAFLEKAGQQANVPLSPAELASTADQVMADFQQSGGSNEPYQLSSVTWKHALALRIVS